MLSFIDTLRLTYIETPLCLIIHETNAFGIIVYIHIPTVPRNRFSRVPIHEAVPRDRISAAIA
jgi:hypothetical protein